MVNDTHGMSSIIRTDDVETVIKRYNVFQFHILFSHSKTHCSVTYRERSRLAKVGK